MRAGRKLGGCVGGESANAFLLGLFEISERDSAIGRICDRFGKLLWGEGEKRFHKLLAIKGFLLRR